MTKNSGSKTVQPCLDKEQLLNLKLRASRSGIWFRALRRIDRVLVDLTLRVTESVHSATLARALFSVVEKLESAFKNDVWSAVHKVGFPLARKLSLIAQDWGNCYARDWAFDESFARFLAIMCMNSVGGSER